MVLLVVVAVVLDMVVVRGQEIPLLPLQVKETMEALALLLQIMVLVAGVVHLPLAAMEQPQQAVTAVTVLHLQSQEHLLPTLAVVAVRYTHQPLLELVVLAAVETVAQLFQPLELQTQVVVVEEGEVTLLELVQQAAQAS
jgi:hypothetical protein